MSSTRQKSWLLILYLNTKSQKRKIYISLNVQKVHRPTNLTSDMPPNWEDIRTQVRIYRSYTQLVAKGGMKMGLFDKLFGKKRKNSKDSEMKELGIMKCPECGFELSIPEDPIIDRYCPMCATLVLRGRGEKTIDRRRVDEKICDASEKTIDITIIKTDGSMSTMKNTANDASKMSEAYNLTIKGVEYEKIGQWNKAVEQYKRAIELSPINDPNLMIYHTNLGVCYYQIDKIEEAVKELETAVKIDPSYERARENLRMVKQLLLGKIDNHDIEVKRPEERNSQSKQEVVFIQRDSPITICPKCGKTMILEEEKGDLVIYVCNDCKVSSIYHY